MAKDPKLYADHLLEAIANIEEDIAGIGNILRHDYHDSHPVIL
ncbi:hypothetical protein [Salinarimonas sp.]